MHYLKKILLERIFAEEVIQGPYHDIKIQDLYALIRKAAEKEFFEDNQVTLDEFLREQFEATQFKSKYDKL